MRFNPLQSKLISCAFAFSLGAPNGRPSTVSTFRFAFVEPMFLQKLKTAHLSPHKLSLLIQLIKAHRLGYKLYIIFAFNVVILVLVDCTMLLLLEEVQKLL